MPDLFVSSVEGSPVQRYGTSLLIGAARNRVDPAQVVFDTAAIVRIPGTEHARYLREYGRAIANGSLRRRTVEEWRAQQLDSQTGAGTPPAPAPAQE